MYRSLRSCWNSGLTLSQVCHVSRIHASQRRQDQRRRFFRQHPASSCRCSGQHESSLSAAEAPSRPPRPEQGRPHGPGHRSSELWRRHRHLVEVCVPASFALQFDLISSPLHWPNPNRLYSSLDKPQPSWQCQWRHQQLTLKGGFTKETSLNWFRVACLDLNMCD